MRAATAGPGAKKRGNLLQVPVFNRIEDLFSLHVTHGFVEGIYHSCVVALLADEETQERVRSAAALMRNQRGAELAGDTIEAYLSGKAF